MLSHDEYDPRVAFDDVYGDYAGSVDHEWLAHDLLSRAHARRLSTPVAVDVVGVDPTRWTFAPIGCDVVGVDEEPAGPIFTDLRQRFQRAIAQPKLLRVDTPESYARFRDDRREPYLRKFEDRLRRLEGAFAQHVADPHAHEVLGALDEAHEAAARGGVPIHLPVSDVACWQDDGEILATVYLPGPNGPILATSGTPVDRHLDEMLGCVWGTGAEPEDVVAVATPVVQVLGATAVVQEICGAISDVYRLAERGPAIGLLQSKSDPSLAAGMALLQRCQRGDRRACAEALEMMHSRKHKKLIKLALDRLLEAQGDRRTR